MASDYLQVTQAVQKISSWPNRKDLKPNPWFIGLGIVTAVLIAVFPPAGLAVGAVVGAAITAAAAGVVGLPALKIVGKLAAKLLLTPIAIGIDLALAPFKLMKDGLSFIRNARQAKKPDLKAAVINSPEVTPAVAEPERAAVAAAPGVAPAVINSAVSFENFLAKLELNRAILPTLTKNPDPNDPAKTKSVSITLDSTGLTEATKVIQCMVCEIEGKTSFTLDLAAQKLSQEDRKNVLEQMCRTAVQNEVPGYAFQVDPTRGTEAERAELKGILAQVRAQKVVPAAMPVAGVAQPDVSAPQEPIASIVASSVILSSTPVINTPAPSIPLLSASIDLVEQAQAREAERLAAFEQASKEHQERLAGYESQIVRSKSSVAKAAKAWEATKPAVDIAKQVLREATRNAEQIPEDEVLKAQVVAAKADLDKANSTAAEASGKLNSAQSILSSYEGAVNKMAVSPRIEIPVVQPPEEDINDKRKRESDNFNLSQAAKEAKPVSKPSSPRTPPPPRIPARTGPAAVVIPSYKPEAEPSSASSSPRTFPPNPEINPVDEAAASAALESNPTPGVLHLFTMTQNRTALENKPAGNDSELENKATVSNKPSMNGPGHK